MTLKTGKIIIIVAPFRIFSYHHSNLRKKIKRLLSQRVTIIIISSIEILKEQLKAVLFEKDEFEYRHKSILITAFETFDLSGFRFQCRKHSSKFFWFEKILKKKQQD